LGLRLKQWDLVERGLRLRAQTWQELAVDSYFRLGNVFVDAGKEFEPQALLAFRQGLNALPREQQKDYLSQVPTWHRKQLEAQQ
jgi:hypothetical protein